MAAPIQVQPNWVPIAYVDANGQILIKEEWRSAMAAWVKAIQDLQARVTALE